MQNVTMYGTGAVRILHGKDTFNAVDGQIVVPPALVPQLEKMGWTTTPTGPAEGDAAAAAPLLEVVTTDERGDGTEGSDEKEQIDDAPPVDNPSAKVEGDQNPAPQTNTENVKLTEEAPPVAPPPAPEA